MAVRKKVYIARTRHIAAARHADKQRTAVYSLFLLYIPKHMLGYVCEHIHESSPFTKMHIYLHTMYYITYINLIQ